MKYLVLAALLSGCATSNQDKQVPDIVACTLAICEVVVNTGGTATIIDEVED